VRPFVAVVAVVAHLFLATCAKQKHRLKASYYSKVLKNNIYIYTDPATLSCLSCVPQARTNSSWVHVVAAQQLHGRTKWHAPPLELRLPDADDRLPDAEDGLDTSGARRGGAAHGERGAVAGSGAFATVGSSGDEALPVSFDAPPWAPVWAGAWAHALARGWDWQTLLLCLAALCCFKWCGSVLVMGAVRRGREGRRRSSQGLSR
jgi:hypothetical protein